MAATDLHELIGDRAEPRESYLFLTLKEFRDALFPLGMAILSITEDISASSTGDELYKVSFQIPSSEIILNLPSKIRTEIKSELLQRLSGFVTVNELESLGRVIRAMWLPDQIQEKLREHEGPILIEVDNAFIPWELMYDEQFVALRVPVGKRLKTEERPKYRSQSIIKGKKALVVGAINTKVPNFTPLEHAEEEALAVKDLLQKAGYFVETLLAERATSLEFTIHLSSGDYNIIHFAGHTYYNEQQDSKGLILYDDRIELNQIKNVTEGNPIVFINSCKSGIGSIDRTYIDYTGGYTLGIAGAFLQGGALACIGSIWKVLDHHGAQFAYMFYEELFSNSNIGEALLNTKRRYYDKFHDDTNNRAWIAYILYGDPTLKTGFLK